MKFKRMIILIFIILTFPATSSVFKKKCGNTLFLIKIKDGEYAGIAEFTLYYKPLFFREKKIHGPVGDWMGIACLKDKNNTDLLVWQNSCMGSGCSDNGVYGIFEPKSKKILLKYQTPSRNKKENYRITAKKFQNSEKQNHKQAAELLGYQPPILFTYKESFCCTQGQY